MTFYWRHELPTKERPRGWVNLVMNTGLNELIIRHKLLDKQIWDITDRDMEEVLKTCGVLPAERKSKARAVLTQLREGDIADRPSISQTAAIMPDSEQILRHLLWLLHGCPSHALYGDDGKMDCNKCLIDFKNQSAKEIEERFYSLGRRAVREEYFKDLKERTDE